MFKFEVDQIFERIETRLVLEEIQVVLHHIYVVTSIGSHGYGHADVIVIQRDDLRSDIRAILQYETKRDRIFRMTDIKRTPCRLVPRHEYGNYPQLFEYQMSRLLCE